MRPGASTLIEEFSRSLAEGGPRLLIFQAPTGYGKTSATPALFRAARSAGVPRLIHSLPLRAVVAQAYEAFLRELHGEAIVGYQAHALGLGGKAPFLAPDLVVTTMDSLLLSLGRVSLGERGLGHYEVPRSSILTSAVVLDEAHLPYQGGDPAMVTALYMAVAALTGFGNPCVVESATLGLEPLDTLASASEGSCVVVEPVPPKAPRRALRRCRYVPVEDPGFFEAASSMTWRFEKGPESLGEVPRLVAGLVEQGLRVFVAVDRVADAAELYRGLEGSVGSAALIHGRMTPGDRASSLARLGRGVDVLVGTSAVEAGVDASFDALVTTVPRTPRGRIRVESLLQRMGRVCRYFECGEARVIFVGEGAGEAEEVFRNVDPRTPYGPRGYARLLDAYGPRGDEVLPRATRGYLLSSLFTKLLSHEAIRRIHEELCNVFRGRALVPVAPHPRDLGIAEDVGEVVRRGAAEELLANTIPVDTQELARNAGRWLELEEGGVKALFLRWSGYRGHPDELEVELGRVGMECLGSCRCVNELLARGLAALVLKQGAYTPGLGLL